MKGTVLQMKKPPRHFLKTIDKIIDFGNAAITG